MPLPTNIGDFEIVASGIQTNRWALIAVIEPDEDEDDTKQKKDIRKRVATLICEKEIADRIADLLRLGLFY